MTRSVNLWRSQFMKSQISIHARLRAIHVPQEQFMSLCDNSCNTVAIHVRSTLLSCHKKCDRSTSAISYNGIYGEGICQVAQKRARVFVQNAVKNSAVK